MKNKNRTIYEKYRSLYDVLVTIISKSGVKDVNEYESL